MRAQELEQKNLEKLPIIGEKPKSEKEEKWLREFVEYEFMNLEEPGLMHKFPYGDTKSRHTFTFFHGGKYKVPRHVARHIENCKTPIWNWKPDGTGSLQKTLSSYKPRFQMRQLFAG